MALTKDEQRVLDSVPKQLLIGGKWKDGSAEPMTVEDPATGEPLCQIANATPEDAMAALDAATEAQPTWKAVAPRERSDILRRAYQMMIDRQDDLALLMTLEMGKSLVESKGEIVYAAEFLRWFSEEAVRINGRWSNEPSGAGRLLTMKQPVGPCLLITPASATPLTMLALGQIFLEAGLPEGVLSIITSSSTGKVMKPLIQDQRLGQPSFTRFPQVRRVLMEEG